MINMIRIFFDSDGTIAQWLSQSKFEDLLKPGYFGNLPPYYPMLETVRLISMQFDTYILTAFITEVLDTDGECLIPKEKNEWYDKYTPYIPREKRIFVPCTESKSKYVGTITKDDWLIDDYTKNLNEWVKCGGSAIKAINDINGHGKTWNGSRISVFENPYENVRKIKNILGELK